MLICEVRNSAGAKLLKKYVYVYAATAHPLFTRFVLLYNYIIHFYFIYKKTSKFHLALCFEEFPNIAFWKMDEGLDLSGRSDLSPPLGPLSAPPSLPFNLRAIKTAAISKYIH